MQGAEIWQELGEWITANKPQFGPGTKERFEMASKLTPEEVTSHAPALLRMAPMHLLSALLLLFSLPHVLDCCSLHHRANWLKAWCRAAFMCIFIAEWCSNCLLRCVVMALGCTPQDM